MKYFLVPGGVLAAVTILLVPSLLAGQQYATRFEYAHVSTYSAVTQTQGVSMLTTMGYRACMAVDNDWKCRTFDRADRSDTALQTTWATTLTTLGNEGWELVSVVQDPPATSANTYIFKRQRQ